MLNNNLITQTNSEGKDVYVVTEKGLDFLQKHNELIRLLKTYDSIKKEQISHSKSSQRNLTLTPSNVQAPKIVHLSSL